MGYLFLTGATGLLGAYLIRDLMRHGVELAVLVRSTKFASAQERIETLLARWEKQAGHSLPRPIIFEGDLTQPEFGLDESALDWVSENCSAIMHNAASLTFVSESKEDEPWRSNVGGTKNVLAFAQRTGIREFHHVSTAYVCGLRTDLCKESELDVGQEFGNDYEISKVQSEQMVRDADFIDDLTVYRPGIIFGDSNTGYTSTYHGFYVPLKLVSTLIEKSVGVTSSHEELEAMVKDASVQLSDALELVGNERKHYVPVDWVSAAMAEIYATKRLHGSTYHLTPDKPVDISLTQRVMEEIFLKFAKVRGHAEQTTDLGEFIPVFLEGMNVYRSYWRDDPNFDTSNIKAALPHLPCPVIDEAMIAKMCRFAIESNFGWPRTPKVSPKFNVHHHIEKHVDTNVAGRSPASSQESPNGKSVHLGLQVNGLGGGQWEFQLDNREIVSVIPGISDRCTARYYLNSQTFESLQQNKLTAEDAVRSGRVLVEGNGVPLPELSRILQSIAIGQQDKTT